MAKKPEAVDVLIPDVPARAIPPPKIEVYERGLVDPFGTPSFPVELIDATYECRWVNTADISGDQLAKMEGFGYQKVEPWMLKHADRVSYTVSPEGYVTRGSRHGELLMYIPKDLKKQRELRKAQINRDSMNPYRTKQEVVQAASAQLGDEAADYLHRHTGPVGNVVDSHEIIERTGEGE